MKEMIELRIAEDKASKVFDPSIGRKVGLVRVVDLSPDDARIQEVLRAQAAYASRGERFYATALPKRAYSRAEMEDSRILQLRFPEAFEPTGEETGTVYDYNTACDICGAGRRQVSDLRLDLRELSADTDAARTIAGEVVFSSPAARIMKRRPRSGVQLRPVFDRGELSAWYQPVVSSPSVVIRSPTRFGIDAFDDDARGEYRCPLGHVVGLRQLSQLSIDAASWDGSDLAQTEQLVGLRKGLLVPEPLTLISLSLWTELRESGMRGFEVEPANVI